MCIISTTQQFHKLKTSETNPKNTFEPPPQQQPIIMLSPRATLVLTLMAGQCLATAIPRPPLADDLNPSANASLVKRQGRWHLQQLAAGKKIEVDTSKLEDVDMLNGAGAGVDIYIFDSGIRLSHVALRDGRASNFKDVPVSTYLSMDSPWDDDSRGHGTHVAGLAGGAGHGVAQFSSLINVKIEHCEQSNGNWVCRSGNQGVLDALNDVIAKHNEKKANPPAGWKGKVINMSLGIAKLKHNGIGRALERAFNSGIPIATGTNAKAEGTLCESPHTICVGATTSKYSKLDISKDGPNVDIWALGSVLISASKEGDEAIVAKTGTSMASPLVAGIMATIVGYEGPLTADKSTQFVYDRLLDNALKGVMPSLSTDEKNVFAETGINVEKNNKEYQVQPYAGVNSDYTILADPYGSGIWRKRGSPEAEQVGGYKTTKVENGDPNDMKPLLFVQEKLWNEPEPLAGDNNYMPTIADDGSDDGGEDEKDKEENKNPGKPICEGNQIYQDCEGSKLPEVKDNSGPQQPVCMKADGSPGSPARLNEKILYKAVSGYCKELVDKKWLFKEGAPTPKAAILEGQAQNGKSMSVRRYSTRGLVLKARTS
ncbi:Peptidase S8/S53 domain containing protein [Rhypophila sp. PSN 637]